MSEAESTLNYPSEEPGRKTAEKIKIKLRMSDNSSELIYQIKTHTPLQKLFDNYCARNDLDPNTVRFNYDGRPVKGNTDSAAKWEMVDGDVIEVFRKNDGGGYLC